MPTIEIPMTAYSVQHVKPGQVFGSPAHIPIQHDEARAYFKGTFDRIPDDGTITSAILRVNIQQDKPNSVPLSVRAPLEPWGSDIAWNSQPDCGATMDTVTHADPRVNQNYDFDITSWAINRNRHGLRVDTSEALPVWIFGSSANVQQPKMIVTYTMKPLTPSDLQPNGGYVSTPAPILAFRGDDDMTEKLIEFSTTGGSTVTWSSDWITSKSMTYDPAKHSGSPSLAVGESILWRVTTRGPEGTSKASSWASYSYQPLPEITITAPGELSNDGSPTLVWEVGSQSSFKVDFYNDETGDLKDSSGWRDNASRRDWTPSKGLSVPGKIGRFDLSVHDGYVPRIVAPGAPIVAHKKHRFETTKTPQPPVTPPTPPPPDPPPETDYETDPNPTPDADPDSDTGTGEGSLVGTGTDGGSSATPDTIAVSFSEPIVTVTGARAVGIPDQISLFRDGEQVTIWDEEGVGFKWAPGARFFTSGTEFSIKDMTAPLRGKHTWEVKIKSNATMSGDGPTANLKLSTRTVWLIDPTTKKSIEIIGADEAPVISQETSENSILHMPINGGPIVEPIRRRITRSTKYGSVVGSVSEDDDDMLEGWIESNGARRYRLVFGKVNWPVIIGDYSPVEVGYIPACEPGWTLISFNWWQRKEDF